MTEHNFEQLRGLKQQLVTDPILQQGPKSLLQVKYHLICFNQIHYLLDIVVLLGPLSGSNLWSAQPLSINFFTAFLFKHDKV